MHLGPQVVKLLFDQKQAVLGPFDQHQRLGAELEHLAADLAAMLPPAPVTNTVRPASKPLMASPLSCTGSRRSKSLMSTLRICTE